MRLKVAGYLGKQDRAYLADIERRLERVGLADRYEYVGELDRPGKIAFLQSLDVFSVPTEYQESKGLPALEAWAKAASAAGPPEALCGTMRQFLSTSSSMRRFVALSSTTRTDRSSRCS